MSSAYGDLFNSLGMSGGYNEVFFLASSNADDISSRSLSLNPVNIAVPPITSTFLNISFL